MNFRRHPSFDDIPAGAWNALLAAGVTNAPFLRHEYLSTWWQTRGGDEWPPEAQLCLVSAERDGQLVGIAPLFLSDGKLWLLGSVEISDYLDLVARPEDLPSFLSGLLDWLDSSDSAPPVAWSALEWVNLPENSPTLNLLDAESARRGWSYAAEVYEPTPSIPLPGDFDAYLAGIDKKQRHEIRRKMRRAEESGRNLRWYIVQDESQLDSEMDGFLALMAQDPEKAAFLTEVMRSQMKTSVHAAFRAGWLQLAFLEVDGEKACGYLNFDYANKIWVYNSGLDRRFMDLSPGWVLLGYLLQWANENQRAEFDFMRGDEDYKYKFGGLDRHVMRVSVARKSS